MHMIYIKDRYDIIIHSHNLKIVNVENMLYVCTTLKDPYFIDNQFFQQGFLPIRNSYSFVTSEYGSFNRADCLHLQCKNWIIDELNFLQAFKRTMTNHKRQFSTHFEFTYFILNLTIRYLN